MRRSRWAAAVGLASVAAAQVAGADGAGAQEPVRDPGPSPTPLKAEVDPRTRPLAPPADGRDMGNGSAGFRDGITLGNDEAGRSPGSFASRMTTHIVYVRVAGDEEWRSGYGANWTGVANDALERADNPMYDKFGIDLRSYSYANWDSNDSQTGACQQMTELSQEIGIYAAVDIVMGYSKHAGAGGCAAGVSGNKTYRHAVVQNSNYNWQATQHEVSHLVGAPDRYFNYAGDNPSHTDDLMEDPYDHPDSWCIQSGYNDAGRMSGGSGRFD